MDGPRVLVVEDEAKLLRVLELELRHAGYQVTTAQRGGEGLDLALGSEWDLILLDVMLPEIDGFLLCREIRQKSDVPIILLTAKGEIGDRVKGLDAGADDYVVKPFYPEELLARIRAVFRRRSQDRRPEETQSLADLVLNPNTREVRRGGKLLDLSKKEYDLLKFLMDNSPWVMSREVIIDKVWGFDFVGGSNIVDVHIRRLRSKVDDDFPVKLIHSVRGVGYVLREP